MRGRTFDDIRYILMAGGGVNMSALGWSEDQLRFLALAAAGSKKKPLLVLRDVDGFTSDQLRLIGLAGE